MQYVLKDRRESLPSVTLQQMFNRIRTVWQQVGQHLNTNDLAIDKRPIQIEYDAYVPHALASLAVQARTPRRL